MGLVYVTLGLVAIGVANWAAYRWLSRRAASVIFAVTAASPLLYFVGFNSRLVIRDGLSTFSDPYFGVLLMILAGCSIVTAIAAFLGRERGLRARG